VGKFKPDLIIT